MILLCAIIFVVWWICLKHKPTGNVTLPFNTEIGLVMYGASTFLYKPLLITFCDIQNISVRENCAFSFPTVTREMWKSKFVFNWQFISVIDKGSKRKLNLPQTLSMTLSEQQVYNRIMKDFQTFRLVGKQNEEYFDIYTWDRRDREHSSSGGLF